MATDKVIDNTNVELKKECMSKNKKLSIIFHSVFIALVIVAMGLAVKYDLAISKAIGNQSNFFGVLFQKIAEYPSYIVLPITSVIIFYNADRFTEKKHIITFRILGIVLSIGGWFIFSFRSEKLVEIPHLLGFSIFASLFYTGIGLWIGSFAKRETMYKLLKWAIFAIIFLAAALAVMQIMKLIWSRMRYRDMLKEGNFDGFTPWYKINFGVEKLSEDYHYTSFPSGHTSSAVHMFLLIPLCKIIPSWNKQWVKYTVWAVAISFSVLTAVARIINCAHFLSDVVAGGSITYLIYVICEKLCFKNGKYEYSERLNV